jgi:hypothetical protein
MKTRDSESEIQIVKAAKLNGDQQLAMICISQFYGRILTETYMNATADLSGIYSVVRHHPNLALVTESLRKIDRGDAVLSKDMRLDEPNTEVKRALQSSLDRIKEMPFQAAIAELVGLGGWLKHHPELVSIGQAVQNIIEGYAGLAAVDYLTQEF